MATRVIRCSLVLVKILERYIVREVVPPLLLALLPLTFVLMMPPMLQNAAALIETVVPCAVVLRVLMTLTPQALCVALAMACLCGVPFGLGRLSADRGSL